MRIIGKIFYISLILFSCSTSKNDPEEKIAEHNYSEVNHLQTLWDELFLKDDSSYYFYYYREHCEHCFKIKNEVIDIALKNKKKIYFCKDENAVIREYDTSSTIDEENIENVFINGFPSIILIKNKKIKKNIVGATKIVNELRNSYISSP